MNLEQLEHLEAFARCKTLIGAAQDLHISESSLSRSLRRLEENLGTKLFLRTRNSMTLNDQGMVALDHAKRILADVEQMRRDLDEGDKRMRTLRVASVAPAPTWFLSSCVLRQWPTMILEPDLIDADDIEARLLRRECDLAVSTRMLPSGFAESAFIMREDLFANVPRDSDLAGRESLTFADLDGRTILVFEQIGFWREVHRKMMPHATFVVQRDRTVFLQQVEATDLLCFTTKAPHNTSAHPNRVQIPILDEEAHASYWLGVRKDADGRVREVFELARAAAETS